MADIATNEEGIPFRSVSQISNYLQCHYRHKLERIDRVPQRPAAWFPMGTAVHAALEKYMLGATIEVAFETYQQTYDQEVENYLQIAPFEEWFWSGPYDGEEDTNRRLGIGFTHLENAIAWIDKNEPTVWTDSKGTPGIEYPFQATLGGIPVRGYMDVVWTTKDNRMMVIDWKTGKPESCKPIQIGTYSTALRMMGEQVPDGGAFFLTKNSSRPLKLVDLDEWSDEEVEAWFQYGDTLLESEDFEPNPGEHCQRCGVAAYCQFAQV